jgi:hypothetical protein
MNYGILTAGRAASTSLRSHIRRSLSLRGLEGQVESADSPTWIHEQQDRSGWTLIIATRRDWLAQALSFYTIIETNQTHNPQGREISTFSVPRHWFFYFAYWIICFDDKISQEDLTGFSAVHRMVYEDITADWTATGRRLGFDDWQPRGQDHSLGYGRVWSRVENRVEVLSWVREIQQHHAFSVDLSQYPV